MIPLGSGKCPNYRGIERIREVIALDEEGAHEALLDHA
jgi:hypothetical protein